MPGLGLEPTYSLLFTNPKIYDGDYVSGPGDCSVEEDL